MAAEPDKAAEKPKGGVWSVSNNSCSSELPSLSVCQLERAADLL